MRRPSSSTLLTVLLASSSIHAAGLAAVALLGAQDGTGTVRRVDIDLVLEPAPGDGFDGAPMKGSSAPEVHPVVPPERLGGKVAARADVAGAGRGAPAAADAVNLASRLADVSLTRETYSRSDMSQTHRLKTARKRTSRDFRRATPEPMELTLLASGTGPISQRRRFGNRLPGKGRNEARRVALLGEPPRRSIPGDWAILPPPNLRGSPKPVPHSGIKRAAAPSNAKVAPVRKSVPHVRRGPAALPAERRDRPNDTVDSRLAVKQRVAALISASTLGGHQGTGEGGPNGSGAGEGGRRLGSDSTHSGPRLGGSGDDSTDPQEELYYAHVRGRLRALTNQAFPLGAKLEGRGGVSVLAFRISERGMVSDIRVTRPSGVPGFDSNLVAALRRTALKPPPKGSLRLSFRFDAINPPVSRR